MAALTSAGRKTGTSGGVCGRLWQGRQACRRRRQRPTARAARQARAEHSLGQSRLSSTVPTRHHSILPPCRVFSMVSFSFRASLHSRLAANTRHSSTNAAAPTAYCAGEPSSQPNSPQLNHLYCTLLLRARWTPEPPVLSVPRQPPS